MNHENFFPAAGNLEEQVGDFSDRPENGDKESYNRWIESVRKRCLEQEVGNYFVADSKIEGRGWFAKRDFQVSDVISHYLVGPYEDLRTIDQLIPDSEFTKSVVQFGIGPHGEGIYIGVPNHPRKYINHSCKPNVGLRIVDLANKESDCLLVCIDSIKRGEEITLDYSTTQLEEWQMECRCGTDFCRHTITDFARLAPELQDKYIKLGIIPDWMIKAVRGNSQ